MTVDTPTQDGATPNILDDVRRPTNAYGGALPVLRLFQDYVTEPFECLKDTRDALASVDPEFWEKIEQYFVVAGIGVHNLGKSHLLKILFGVDFTVVDGMGTACIEIAFARLGSYLFIMLDTEGNNSVVEHRREAASIDHGPSGEGIRSNFVVASAHMVLLSFKWQDRALFHGYTSDLDNLFQSAQRDGAATDRCLVVLVVRDIDTEFRDKVNPEVGKQEVLAIAEERREFHIARNGRWAAQLKRFVFRVIMLCHPRDHHHPNTPPSLDLQQQSAHDRFVEGARKGVGSIVSSGDIAGMGVKWESYQLYLDILQEAMSEAWRPPYVINIAERFARRYRIDQVVNDVRDRIGPSVHEAQQTLLRLRKVWTCLVTEAHHCQSLDIEWIADEHIQRRCADNVYVDLKGRVAAQANLTKDESVSDFVKEYWNKLRIDIHASVITLWNRDRSMMDAQLRSCIERNQVRVDQFLHGIQNQRPDAYVQAILASNPSLRIGPDDTFVSLRPAYRAGQLKLAANINCTFDMFMRSGDSSWYEEATAARDKLLGELNGGFDKENTTYRQLLIDLPDLFAGVARATGQCVNYIAAPTIGAISGSPLGPPGMVLGALGGGASAHWVTNTPVKKLGEFIGMKVGKLCQGVLHKATVTKRSKTTNRRYMMI